MHTEGIALGSSLSDVQYTATGCPHPGRQCDLWLYYDLRAPGYGDIAWCSELPFELLDSICKAQPALT